MPYAITSENVFGGVVDVTEVRVNGSTVIDGSGTVAGTINYSDIVGVPADNDTLPGLGCSIFEVARHDGSGWVCAPDNDHAHIADDITSGVMGVARLPVGTTSAHVAAGDHVHTAAEVGALPTGTTAADIGALPVGTTAADIGGLEAGSTTAADVGALPDSGGTLTGGLTIGTELDGACGPGAVGLMRLESGLLEMCDGSDWVRILTESTRDGTSQATAGLTCADILLNAPLSPDGTYWIDPDGDPTGNAYQVHCNMAEDGGGWTKLFSSQWPRFWTTGNYEDHNASTPTANNYSILNTRTDHEVSGCYTFRLEVGNSGTWTSANSHVTVWEQCHDPFTAATNGSDYTFISGTESTTCGGFNGLHNRVPAWGLATDPDTTDGTGCWWMQIVATNNYNGQGYLEGWGGSGNYHQWQALYVR